MGVQRAFPGAKRGRARLDLGEGRRRQVLVAKHLELELENFRRVVGLRSRERRKLGGGLADRLLQSGALGIRRPGSERFVRRSDRHPRQVAPPQGLARPRDRAAEAAQRLIGKVPLDE